MLDGTPAVACLRTCAFARVPWAPLTLLRRHTPRVPAATLVWRPRSWRRRGVMWARPRCGTREASRTLLFLVCVFVFCFVPPAFMCVLPRLPQSPPFVRDQREGDTVGGPLVTYSNLPLVY